MKNNLLVLTLFSWVLFACAEDSEDSNVNSNKSSSTADNNSGDVIVSETKTAKKDGDIESVLSRMYNYHVLGVLQHNASNSKKIRVYFPPGINWVRYKRMISYLVPIADLEKLRQSPNPKQYRVGFGANYDGQIKYVAGMVLDGTTEFETEENFNQSVFKFEDTQYFEFESGFMHVIVPTDKAIIFRGYAKYGKENCFRSFSMEPISVKDVAETIVLRDISDECLSDLPPLINQRD